MASFNDNFEYPTSQLSADWTIINSSPINRIWYTRPTGGGYLAPQDTSTQQGIIINKTEVTDNVVVIVTYAEMGGLDQSNGTDNSILLRYQDTNKFLALKIEANDSDFDNKGVFLHPDELNQTGGIDYRVDMYNAFGVNILDDQHSYIPTDGIVEVHMNGDTYTIFIYNSLGEFAASGVKIDTNHTYSPSKIGFGHSSKWDANIYGWGGISASDGTIIPTPPTITSFSATSYTIPEGGSTTLGWTVTSGSDSTSVFIDQGIGSVSLDGTTIVSPSATTTYEMSAWNVNGSDTSVVTIEVFTELPKITFFNNTSPVSAGGSVTVNWETTAATSAFIDQGIGWIDSSAVSSGSFSGVYTQDVTYTMTAMDDNSNSDVSATTVDVVLDPNAYIDILGTPICSGADYFIQWNTQNATSAFINQGIGEVAISGGTLSVSSDGPLTYTLSAYNSMGILSTDDVVAEVYYSTPVVFAGDDASATSIDGWATVQFDGSQTYDPQNIPMQYAWYMNGTSAVVSTDAVYNTTLSGGTYSLELVATNGCGNSASDTTIAYITELHSPVASATATPQYVNELGAVTQLDGSSSYDIDGVIVDYKWYVNGSLIGLVPTFNYTIPDYGVYVFDLVVVDDDGLSGTDSVTVINTERFNPSANAGPDENYCVPFTSATTDVYLDGSSSLPSDTSGAFNIVWYNWGLSAFGVSDVSGTVSSVQDISASIPNVANGDYTATLTVSADSTRSDTDSVDISVNTAPSISGYGEDVVLPVGAVLSDVTLSAYSDISNPLYVWAVYTGGYMPRYIVGDQFPTITNLSFGTYYANLQVIDNDTHCVSNERVDFSVSPNDLQIIDFNLDPSLVIGYPSSSVPVNLSWSISNATSAEIDNGIGFVDPVSGTIPLELVTGDYTFTLSAWDGPTLVAKTVLGHYETIYTSAGYLSSVSACKTKENYIKTYGVDEIRYGTNRDLNLIKYLPEYLQGTETVFLVEKFQYYLNNLYKGQKNYSLEENLLELNACQTSACGVSAVDNNYTYDNVSGDILTPTYKPVGEVFIKDICRIPEPDECDSGMDSISILDKIFRITDMFDPDLIPIELIQFYAENLGYNVGINRESISYSSDDPKAVEFEQRRYLRFMVRNLPTWYKIKTNRSSIKIMLYSFGLVGTFVYYYTKNYCDVTDTNIVVSDKDVFGQSRRFKCLTDNVGPFDVSGSTSTSGTSGVSQCDNNIILNNDKITPKDIEKLRCCLLSYGVTENDEAYKDAIDKANNDSADSWVLTRNDPSSVFESLDNPKIRDNYLATPHFRLWVDILDSDGNLSIDKDRQRMVAEAINAVKPINTVFDGVSVYFDAGINTVYVASYMRIRKSIKVYGSC